MNLLDKFSQTLGFTRTESLVILFLVVTFIAGIGLKLYNSYYPGGRLYDYAALDSEFTARSAVAGVHDSPAAAGTGYSPPAPGTRDVNQRIDINKADREELMNLPGIGEVMAERIIIYRKEKGAFKNIRDLLKVKGIGRKKLEQIAHLVVVEK